MGCKLSRQPRSAELSEISVQVQARLWRGLQVSSKFGKGFEDRFFVSDLGEEGPFRSVLTQQSCVSTSGRLFEAEDRTAGLHVLIELGVVPPSSNVLPNQ